MLPPVVIVIVQYGGWRHTSVCLKSLSRLNYPAFRIIVVDNGSPDKSSDHLEYWAKSQKIDYIRQTSEKPPTDHTLTILDLPQNRGYAGGNNAAIRLLLENDLTKYFWLLNNDTEVEPSALSRLVERLECDQSIGLAGSTILYSEQRQTVQALAGGHFVPLLAYSKLLGEGQPWDTVNTSAIQVEKRLDFILGASCLVRKDFLEQVGLMDESLFLYFEELDWALRARGRFSLTYAPESIVYHKEGASIQAGNLIAKNKSYLADYYFHRNRLAIVRRYYPLCLFTAYASLLVTFLRRIIKGHWNRLPILLRAATDALWLREKHDPQR